MHFTSLIGIGVLSLSIASLPVLAQEKPPAAPTDAKPQDRPGAERGKDKSDLPPFEEVAKDYEKVVSVADGTPSLYTIWVDKKRNQILAELPKSWASSKYFVAPTQASGGVFAGLQGRDRPVYWKRYDNRLALIEPELETRSTGEPQSKSSVERLFTDYVITDVPIVCMGPGGQPVIDLDDLLVGKAAELARFRDRNRPQGAFGGRGAGPSYNTRLQRIVKTKAFPQNVEIAIEAPNADGVLVTMHYSISQIPESSGYKPREADERVGYFTTVYRDLGQYDEDKKWTRYINRWHLEKRDPKLRLSPPKEPIVFYIEHTVPIRYRRWLRDGVLYWNNAFEKVGLIDAIEVQYQDKETGAHMDKDPEDVRYNFIRWLNNDISTAIGPSRAHPMTGQILDADVVLTDGWIRAYWGWYNDQMPEMAVEGFSAETLSWLEDHPDWDPRMLLGTLQQRQRLTALIQSRKARIAAGELVDPLPADPALAANPDLASIAQWSGHDESHYCLAAHGRAFDMCMAQMTLETLGLIEELAAEPPVGDPGSGGPDAPKPDKPAKDEDEKLDGIPEWFVGPLLAELVCHEVGHTLGLRHNFKASSLYTMAQINSEEFKGKKPLAGSVMDYLPPNFNMGSGEIQGDFAMINIGPYDMWAIEYGYTFDDPKKVVARCAEPELAFLTDDDTQGPDPLARRYDFAADPDQYAVNIMRIVNQHRGRVLDKYVQDGQSWSKARRGYEVTLGMQMRAVSMMAFWVGGAHVNRDHKGDPNGRVPVQVVDVAKQREALKFVIENTFKDDAFGLTPDLIAHMTVDKWSDDSPGDRSDSTYPVHDRIMAIQASTLTMLMNPTTLKRAYDNEVRTPMDQDALTLAELLGTLDDAVYAEFDLDLDGVTFTDRKPMISSLRRNLQSTMTDRLIYLADGDNAMPLTIRTLAMMHLRNLNDDLDGLLAKQVGGQIDQYTLAHLQDLNDRVDRALDVVQVTMPR
jgi:hypothetical protein